MKKSNFVDTLRHGKCGGRKQLHDSFIHPHYCINENSGNELHVCPDADTYFESGNKCNCCQECKEVCETAAKIRSENTMKNIYDQWKVLLKND